MKGSVLITGLSHGWSKVIFFFLVVISAKSVQSQYWLLSAGSPQLDIANDIVLDSDDNSYTVGSFSGSFSWGLASQSMTSSGLRDGFLVGFDDLGEYLWHLQFSGNGMDVANGVTLSTDGSLYVCGTFEGTLSAGDTSLIALGNSDAFIAKVDIVSGEVIWLERLGGSGSTRFRKIAADNEGNAYAIGEFNGSVLVASQSLSAVNGSYDVIVAKIDSQGQWQWAKSGQADEEDIGADIAIDASGNVFVTGTYSNTITFDSTHPNNALNVAMAVKFSSSGEELGFHRISATQIESHSIGVSDEGECFVAGRSQGNIEVDDLGSTSIDNDFSFFVVKFNASFDYQWVYEDGSSSEVSGECITVDSDGVIYVAGTFKCEFSDYAELEDMGPFVSSGFNDVFVTAVTDGSASASHSWSRQYGGPGTGGVYGIAVGTGGHVYFCGDFERFFHVPSSPNFSSGDYWTPDPFSEVYYPNEGSAVCNDSEYGAFKTIEAVGQRDIYISNAIDLDAWPFDIFHREDCSEEIVSPCIVGESDFWTCESVIEGCGIAYLYANSMTGSDGFIGPSYDYSWSNGGDLPENNVDQAGVYTVSIEREDGCFGTQNSSVTVAILPAPEIDVNVTGEYSENSDFTYTLCEQTCLSLTGSPSGGYWSNLDIVYNQSSIDACESGVFSYVYTDINDCEAEAQVTLITIDQPTNAQPELQFLNNSFLNNAQEEFCVGENISMEWIDALEHPNFNLFSGASWTVFHDGQMIYSIEEGGNIFSFFPYESGTYTITSVPFIFNEEPCMAIDFIYFDEQTLQLNVTLLETPNLSVALDGPAWMCSGDSVILHAEGGINAVWTASTDYSPIDSNTIIVFGPGTYGVTISQTLENGCSDNATDVIEILEPVPPIISSNPEHNYLCPGATVQLETNTNGSFLWYYESTLLGDTGSTLTVSVAGSYSCVQDFGSCVYESIPIEIINYSTPYIVNTPNDLCLTGEVELCISTYNQADFNWQEPLSGNQNCVTVNAPGEYSAIVVACGITTTVTGVVIDTEFVPVISSPTDFLCTGYELTLYGPPNMEAYEWSPIGDSSQNVVIATGGSYLLNVTDSNGCVFSSEPFLIEQVTNQPPVISDRVICRGDAVEINVSGDGLSWWISPSENIDTVQNNQIQVATINETLTIYFFEDDGICRSPLDSFQVALWPSSNVDILQNDTSFCADGSYELSTNCSSLPGIQFLWNLPDGTVQTGSSLFWMDSNNVPSGLYFVRTADVHCINGIDSVMVNVESPHSKWIFESDSAGVCIGSDILLTPDSALEEVVWLTPQGIFTSGELFLENADYPFQGEYILSSPGLICDLITDTIVLKVVDYPEVILNDSTVYCSNGYLIAHLNPNFDSYAWSNGDSDENTVIPADGQISVTVSLWPGCYSSGEFVTASVPCIDDFPNIITPNGDGLNDIIDFEMLRLPINEVRIYNRWGNLINALNGSRLFWNGRNENNELVSDGVYYWIITLDGSYSTNDNLDGYIHVKQFER